MRRRSDLMTMLTRKGIDVFVFFEIFKRLGERQPKSFGIGRVSCNEQDVANIHDELPGIS